MKKLFAYILIFACLAMLVSCLNEEIHVTDNADENKETNEMIKPVENITNGLNNEDADLVMSSFYCYNYSTFENDINYATDIVKAECVCKTDYAGYTMYDFEVEERFLGDDNVTVLPVRVSKTQYPVVSENGEQLIRMSSIDSEVNYEIGKRYYLILEKYVSVFEENDFYTNVIIKSLIPADDIKSATKYGEPLCNHAAFDFEKSEDSGKDLVIESEKDFANYLFELVKQSAGVERKGSVTDYIRSDDVKVIVNESDYVFRIRVEDIVIQSLSGDRGMYDCTVLETIKGKDGKEITTALFILPFPKIESGTEYIVAVSPLDNVFIISSKHSVFDPSEYETIKGLID